MKEKFRITEIAVCLCIVLIGLLYKYTEVLSLAVVLPVFVLLFTVIPILRYLDGKKRGLTGLGLYLPVLCMGFVAAVVAAAWIVYLMQG